MVRRGRIPEIRGMLVAISVLEYERGKSGDLCDEDIADGLSASGYI